MRKWLLVGVITALGAFLVVQLVPYRVTNPPVRQEPNWDSPRTRQLTVAACYDCHSNETRTTWWEDVAPLSWWITNHVKEGRAALNFSEWGSGGKGEGDAAETISEGSMPPDYYTWLGMHAAAKLTSAERKELVAGLQNSLGGGG